MRARYDCCVPNEARSGLGFRLDSRYHQARLRATRVRCFIDDETYADSTFSGNDLKSSNLRMTTKTILQRIRSHEAHRLGFKLHEGQYFGAVRAGAPLGLGHHEARELVFQDFFGIGDAAVVDQVSIRFVEGIEGDPHRDEDADGQEAQQRDRDQDLDERDAGLSIQFHRSRGMVAGL